MRSINLDHVVRLEDGRLEEDRRVLGVDDGLGRTASPFNAIGSLAHMMALRVT